MMKKTLGLTKLSLEKVCVPLVIIKPRRENSLFPCSPETMSREVLTGGDFSG
jgi:hypothetical protein